MFNINTFIEVTCLTSNDVVQSKRLVNVNHIMEMFTIRLKDEQITTIVFDQERTMKVKETPEEILKRMGLIIRGNPESADYII